MRSFFKPLRINTIKSSKSWPKNPIFSDVLLDMDVETFLEFQDMVKLLEESHEQKAELIVELRKIKNVADIIEGSDSDSDDDMGQDGSYGWLAEGTLSEFETNIAKQCRKLEKKYRIGPDGSGPYMYTYSDGFKLPLTLLMLCEWAVALEENVTTINEPPAMATFDAANKCHKLSDSLTAVAQLTTTALHLVKHITEQSSTRQIPTPVTPHTPKCAHTHDRANSNYSPSAQLLPSPSDIPSFMRYAKDKLGIKDAASYIATLQEN
ncbi:hypothetical protein DFH94DRAFT_698362 [Russula ochroleuca]|uniref:Uncharacterized protein n=1 Tax=Russula ochroleuca TaxID=152965 RepID=A0A9P5JWS3_9AGAM|nr:hypothetical protein DFH94DRAFT_698362 [Russula ochroleuca]